MASYVQAYFQASSMPKRLLQYALSRLEILDTNALGLDNVDIALGKNTVLEFRDVGLRLKKLETLLQLPPSLELTKARILLLRISVPVDVYSSPISVEVEGVESQLRVKYRSEQPTSTSHDRNQKGPQSKPAHSNKEKGGRDPHFEDDPDSVIPTAADLAQSFLQTEPEKERAQLEAALLSEAHDIGTSSFMSEDGELPVGTGTALSLPAFMTSFIQGIVDRVQLRIRGVTFNLDVDIPTDSAPSQPSSATDPVTIQLKIDEVDVEGVTYGLEKGSKPASNHPSPQSKDGKRLVCLSRIRGSLISEANLFSSLARSSALSSPSAAHSDIFEERKSASQSNWSPRESVLKVVDRGSSPEQRSTVSPGFPMKSSSRKTVDPNSRHGSILASDSGRFDDASEDGDGSNMSESGHLSEIGDSFFRNSAYLDQVGGSQYSVENNGEGGSYGFLPSAPRGHDKSLPSALSTPRASVHLTGGGEPSVIGLRTVEDEPPLSMLQSTILPTRSHTRFSADRVSQSQSSLPSGNLRLSAQASYPPSPTGKRGSNLTENAEESDGEEDSSTPSGEDLAQSQLFSHEDAESMYMSALSHDSSSSRFPGGWAHSSSDRSTPGSPKSPQEPTEHLDNLEHARHAAPGQASPENEHTTPSISASDTPGRTSKMTSDASTGTQHIPPMPQSSSGASERSAASSDEYSKLTKQVFTLDRIDIYLPPMATLSGSNAPNLSTTSFMFTSTFDGQSHANNSAINIPGAFSTHLHPPRISSTPHKSPPSSPLGDPEPQLEDSKGTIEVLIGHLLVHFDISIGRLALKLIHQLKDVFNQGPPSTQQSQSEQVPIDRTYILSAQDISLKFLDRLEGTLGHPSELDRERWSAPPETDILLRTTLTGLEVKTHTLNSTTITSLALKKFIFGYAQENIVSFDAALQLKASVRDLKASAGIDISIDITHTSNVTRCVITTLPMHVSIDLQRLDETFSWFGGLSSVLNLGSSIASNATITANSPGKPKPRGVRFETPIRPDDKSMASQNKASVRIGGFILDLVGTECSVGVETSAVKVVSRSEGIGVNIQRIRLSGPHLRRSQEPAINVDITSTSIEYALSPIDADLDRLLSLITPSKAKYDQDDDILLDTLLRQRKQGAVLRVSVDDIQTRIGRLHELGYLPELGDEVSRLSTVAKYLPDDDRPGLLSLITIKKFNVQLDVNNALGIIQLFSTDVDVAQISLPALIALSVNTISVRRNSSEDLIRAATDPELRQPGARAPAIMARMIGDEMEPVVKLKLWNLEAEYRVPTLMILLGLAENATAQDISASLTASVATLTDFARSKAPHRVNRVIHEPVRPGKSSSADSKPFIIDVVLRDCLLGLNPLGQPSKLLVALTEAHLMAALPKDQNVNASLDLSKASLLIIDNVANLTSVDLSSRTRRHSFDGGSTQVADLGYMGYVAVGSLSSAKAIIQLSTNEDGDRSINVELRDDLFVLESCADSTQTLIAILNGLTPPTPPSKEIKYRTKVIPVQDLLASLSGDAFGTAEGDYNFDDDFPIDGSEGEYPGGEDGGDLEFDSHYYQKDSGEQYNQTVLEFEAGSSTSTHLMSRDTRDGVLLESIVESHEEPTGETLEFQDDHFGTGSILEGTAHRWNSAKNTYDRSNVQKVKKSPLKICIRDVHIIWNLFDGYDWQRTRDTITKAVQDVESKAIEKRARNERRPTFDQDIEDEETVIGDFLFNSIYIEILANRDPRELAAAINQELNDNATETESIATTSLSSSPSRQGVPRRSKGKKLRLNRSKHHKITFELRGVSVDLVAFPPDSGETQSSVDIRVHDFEIFDHVPTSTWRKFATYMQDAGERETGTSMIHIEILNVKPVPELAASEIVLKATVLPLRLHVDQDALDFITRFFEFKDDSASVNAPPGDAPFLQRVEVNSIQVKLDFKPKRVDYAGLRSGHTTEFMNFLILDEADMVLRHTIIYGISGFDKLGKTLNDIWMPEIKRNQLPGILAGLAPVRSLVNVGDGFRHLVLVPIREYKKDGRIVRGISKGAAAFAKTTGTELVKLGAKVAIGVQTVLQGAEGFLGPGAQPTKTPLEDDDAEEEPKKISLYANQPVGVMQGLRGGYSGLQRDLLLARDAIIAVPGEVMESGNAAGVLKAVRKHAPTVILRPAIGVAKAGGQILMGATNALDPVNLQKAEAKYKKH